MKIIDTTETQMYANQSSYFVLGDRSDATPNRLPEIAALQAHYDPMYIVATRRKDDPTDREVSYFRDLAQARREFFRRLANRMNWE